MRLLSFGTATTVATLLLASSSTLAVPSVNGGAVRTPWSSSRGGNNNNNNKGLAMRLYDYASQTIFGAISPSDDSTDTVRIADDVPLGSSLFDCGTPECLGKIDYIKIEPDPPKRSSVLEFEGFGTLHETLEEGAYVDVLVMLGKWKIHEERYDLCQLMTENVNLTCPLEKGETLVKGKADIPWYVPWGTYNVSAKAYTAKNETLLCLKATAKF